MAKILMKGNEAIGEAAIRAGCLNYFAYPITPQTEVAEYLSRRMPEVGGLFLQAESEVAASYMLFGAAGAGERVFTTSSSPGISLMSEGISYMAGARLPAVLVNIMRGGPGLGGILPSQSDYNQATKGGGHGDFNLLVLAPASVQEAVEMVMESFPLAEKYLNPVMVLGDGLIGQMMEPVEFPEHLVTKPSNKDSWASSGMETRGSDTRNLVKSLFLDADGLHNHNVEIQKTLREIEANEIRFENYNLDGDYKLLVVSYGTMSRVCKTAIDELKAEGVEVGLVRPKTLWPFPKQAIFEAATKASCKKALSVEMSMGQMVLDVERAVAGRVPVDHYGKCGGLVPTPEEVKTAIENQL